MKSLPAVLLVLTTLALTPPTTHAAKPQRNNKKAAADNSALPSVRLRHLIDTTLPRISSLTPKPKQEPDRTAVAAAHSQWAALAVTAPPAEQATYTAAANVAQALISAIDEHAKAVADYHYSKVVHGPQERQNMDISNGNQRSGTAWANNAKQNKENADSRKELLRKEAFMNKGMIDQWTVRTAQIGTAVEQVYTAELVTEQRMVAARNTPPPPPPPSVPVSTQATASQAYSPVGTWKAEKGPNFIIKGDGSVVRGNNSGTWKWTDQNKGNLHIMWTSGVTGDLNFPADGQTLSGRNSTGVELHFTRGK